MKRSAVILKSNRYGLILSLDPDLPFDELKTAVADKFKTSASFFKNATMAVTFRGRVLTKDQENQLVDTIVENASIHIVCVVDENPDSEELYKNAVTRALDTREQDSGQFYRGTLRSGQVFESETSVVVIGDVNPGAQVISRGNIVVLGCCMGNLYAGAGGDQSCFAAALTMKPMQIRIADKMARSAIRKKEDTGEYPIEPMIVFIKDDHLQIKPITGESLAEYLQ